MSAVAEFRPAASYRALTLSTLAMAICFAVWVIFSIVGVKLQKEMGFSQTAFGLLVATPILTGSLSRLLLGIWTELYGGKRVYTLLMGVVAGCAFLLPFATSYGMLIAVGLGLGLAGGSFSVGVVYVSSFFPREKQGTALGLFGMGNAGAALTSFFAPMLLAVMDWRHAANVYGSVMLATAVAFFLLAQEDPVTRARRASGAKPAGIAERIAPLRNLQVWRFSTYYFLVFGGFIALTSWLPRYYMGVYKIDIAAAGMLTASFTFPTAVFRAVGGMLADRYGARRMMYISFSLSMLGLFLLSYPATHYVIEGIRGPIPFTIAPSIAERAIVLFILGFAMALGMAAVFKHIPTYYPQHVGAVGGVVGMIGGLGGFVLPIAFGAANDLLGIWSSCFMLLFAVAAVSLLWMHFSILSINRRLHPELRTETDLPELMNAVAAVERAKAAAKAATEAAEAAAAAAAAMRRARGT
ncbi:MAG: NarK/NasA family nitrate transporter [Proteobacteria bacterium]|nr:NarK/NasA family nitrate transporter [Pseudomonadota bacterium]